MNNPLFVGLVSFVIQNQDNAGLESFREAMLSWLNRLATADDLHLAEDYDKLKAYWLTELSEENVEAHYNHFETIVTAIEPDSLYWLALPIRNGLLLDSVSELAYSVKSFRVVYSVEWRDGQTSDFCCRPIITDSIPIVPALLGDLGEMFQQHFIDYLIVPGLDTSHDQVSRTFDYEKLEELLKFLHQHVNEKPASERDIYQAIVTRIEHVLGPGPKVNLAQESASSLEWLDNGGGF